MEYERIHKVQVIMVPSYEENGGSSFFLAPREEINETRFLNSSIN